jgi:NAD(P)-dependent dehydrogenase (short-subunit alcohol dehydrogenase family)
VLGKRCVVTGATSGIGKELARELARRGAAVTIVGRNPAKTEAVAGELAADAAEGGGSIDVALADLSLLAQVRQLAADLHERLDRIDVLVNNAGVHTYSPQVTAEGLDTMMATNYLGPWLLTDLVRDLLVAGAPSRVVVTGSEAHRQAIRYDLAHLGEPREYSRSRSMLEYGATKLFDILFTQELATRLAGTGVTANCFCPGLVNTGIAHENRLLSRLGPVLDRTPLVRRPEQGAREGVRLATDPALERVTGGFFSSTPGARLLPASRRRRDRDLQRRLWERTAEVVASVGT